TLALLGVGAALIPLAYLPNLVSRESWGTFRTQGALAGLLGLYLLLGALGAGRAAHGWIRARGGDDAARRAGHVGMVALTAGIAASLLVAARHVTTLFVKPQSAEL